MPLQRRLFGRRFSFVQRIRGRKLQETRNLVLREDPFCVHCKARGTLRLATQVDHIVALVNGGADTIDNMQGLCRECHDSKTRADLGQLVKGCDARGVPFSPWK